MVLFRYLEEFIREAAADALVSHFRHILFFYYLFQRERHVRKQKIPEAYDALTLAACVTR